ncbi:hypothetical protein C2E23DRAFT_422461 [Lenzites betulinus]|nr:hypothetical protein C2E23DRAFT_422461 [Lenzites betulinus]
MIDRSKLPRYAFTSPEVKEGHVRMTREGTYSLSKFEKAIHRLGIELAYSRPIQVDAHATSTLWHLLLVPRVCAVSASGDVIA